MSLFNVTTDDDIVNDAVNPKAKADSHRQAAMIIARAFERVLYKWGDDGFYNFNITVSDDEGTEKKFQAEVYKHDVYELNDIE